MAKLSELPTTFLESVLLDRNAKSFSFTVDGHAALRSEITDEIARRKSPAEYVAPAGVPNPVGFKLDGPVIVAEPFEEDAEMLGLRKRALRDGRAPGTPTIGSQGRKA
jgi:hypothetical protein